MNYQRLLLAVFVGCILFRTSPIAAKDNSPGFAKGAGLIIENKGQITDQSDNPRNDIDFRLVGKGVNLFIGSGHLHYQWSAAAGHSDDEWSGPIAMYRMDISFERANPNARIITEDVQPFFERYYTATEENLIAHAYSKVIYKNIYPNIDWQLYVKDGVPEYDFIIHPGGRVSDIVMSYEGTTYLMDDQNGNLIARTPMGVIYEYAPVAFQSDGQGVRAEFKVSGNNVRFDVGEYRGALTIDPIIDWGTYFGGTLNDANFQVMTDDSSHVYFVGTTASTANIATTGAHQTTYGGGTGSANYVGEAYLAKFDNQGNCLWATYYGGTGADQAHAVAIDTAGMVYMAGHTNSTPGISTTGSFQAAIGGGYDAFLVKFNTNGVRQWATYYGGTGNEHASQLSLACDTMGNIYMTGGSNSASGVATTGSYQDVAGGSYDGFLVKFNGQGQRIWATYFGGAGSETAFQTRCNSAGDIYISGMTTSTSAIASAGASQSVYGGGVVDAYLAKFNSSGIKQWSTYLGGSTYDGGRGLLVDSFDNVYMLGLTNSVNGIATSNVQQTTAGGSDDLFLAKFNGSGNKIWSTYYGGSDADAPGGTAIATDILGRIYIGGRTRSSNAIATAGSMQPALSSTSVYDGFVAKFDTSGVRLWGTYLGDVDVDLLNSITTDDSGSVYCSGETDCSAGIATSGTHQTSFAGGVRDAFLIKLFDCDTPAQPGVITGPVNVCKGQSYTYSISPLANVTGYTWTLPGGWAGSSNSNTITVVPGGGSGHIQVSGNTSCAVGTAQSLPVTIDVVAQLSPSGNVEICANDSIALVANTGSNFNWEWLRDGSILPGQNASQIFAAVAGQYQVIISDGICTDTSLADTLTVNPLPTPTISVNGNDLSTQIFYTSYQWYFDGQPIGGAINSVYTAAIDGHYTVSVTDTNGCSALSAVFTKGFPENIDQLGGTALGFYPNPASDRIFVSSQAVRVEIVTADGRTLNLKTEKGSVDISGLPNGVYMIGLKSSDNRTISRGKLIKRK